MEILVKISKKLNITVSELLGEIPSQLHNELIEFINNSKVLSEDQLKVLITVAKAFKVSSSGSIEEEKDIKPYASDNIATRATHFEVETGLREDEQSVIDFEIARIKKKYNPDGTLKK